MMRDTDASKAAARERSVQMLRTAFGPAIIEALDDPDIDEVMLNPDGRIWVDRLRSGREPTGVSRSPADAARIIRSVAACVQAEVHRARPPLATARKSVG